MVIYIPHMVQRLRAVLASDGPKSKPQPCYDSLSLCTSWVFHLQNGCIHSTHLKDQIIHIYHLGDAWHSLLASPDSSALHLPCTCENPSQLSPPQPEEASLCHLVLTLPAPLPCLPNVISHNCPALSHSHCQGSNGSCPWSYNATTLALAFSFF